MQNQPNRRNQSPPQTPSQNPQQNSSENSQQSSAQPAAFPQVALPYAYPFGWSYMHPVNPLNPIAMPPMNPMYGMYFPYLVAPNSESSPNTKTLKASPVKAEPSDHRKSDTNPVKTQASPQSSKVAAAPPSQKRTSFNLDDPEDLEKWKAERRKRFPSRTNATEPVKEEKPPTPTEDTEEGELSESEKSAQPKAPTTKKLGKNRICKYFAAGKCKNGESCAFAHDKTAPSGQTVFETLQGKQEREDLLKFYNILKIISLTHVPLPAFVIIMMMMTLKESCDFLNSTQGLDKLYRLVSYAAKLAAALAEKKGKEAFTLHDSMNRLGRNISHTRTVMRLVGLLHNAKLTREWISEHLNTSCLLTFPSWQMFRSFTRVLTNYTYLPCDHLAWMGREGIVYIQDDWIGFLSRLSAQSWFVGLVVELIDWVRSVRDLVVECKLKLREGKDPVNRIMNKFNQQLWKLVVKAVLIAADLPLSINYSRREQFMSPLAVGLCGTLSSTAALYMRWESHFGPK